MATIGRLIVKIGANIDGLQQGIKKARGLVGQITGKFGGLAKVLQGPVGAGLAVAGAGLALMTTAMLTAGTVAFQMSREMSSAMRNLQAETGATAEEMEGLRQSTLDIYTSGFGQSITDVAESLGTVRNITQTSGRALEQITTEALILRDVFGKDVQESVRAADTAVETFGVSWTTAFDMITATIQRTGDPADDLLDTVNEYSTIFAQAGFSAQEMFGILESGLNAGARNFDVVADAVKEFQIRIIDGSDTTREALNDLFVATGQGGEFAQLSREIEATEQAMEQNTAALEEAEGAYAAIEEEVGRLESALAEAQRRLDELSRPNLVGMEEFDDKMFDLEQQSKRTQLALLDMQPDTDAYERTQEELDRINNELDRVRLQRDLALEPQLRAIEKAAKAGTEEIVTFDEAMSQVAAQKDKIADLENQLASAKGEMETAGGVVDRLSQTDLQLNTDLAELQGRLEAMGEPAEQILAGLADGSISGRDAMSQVIQMLSQVDDQVARNQIGVALFGTKWEDLGPDIILAMDPAKNALADFEGATEAAGQGLTDGPFNTFTQLLRDLKVELIPLGDILVGAFGDAMPTIKELIQGAIPIIQGFTAELGEKLGPAAMIIVDALNRMGVALGITNEEASGMDMVLGFLRGTLDLVVTSVEALAVVMHFLANGVESATGWLAELNEDKLGTLAKMLGGPQAWVTDAVGGAATSGLKGLLGFAEGGVVPGPVGQPTLAVVHGGETITPPGQTGGNTAIVNIDGVSVTARTDEDPADEAIRLVIQQLRQQLKGATP
jgi:phage-related minor tail protein